MAVNYTSSNTLITPDLVCHLDCTLPSSYIPNLLTYTDSMSSEWAYAAGTYTANGSVSPIGTSTALKVTATNADPYLYHSTNQAYVRAGKTYNASVWVRGEGTGINRTFFISLLDGTAWATNSFVSLGGVPSGWTRFSQTFTPANSGSAQVRFETPEAASAGDVVSVWGAQLTEGSALKTYYPVTSNQKGTWYDLSPTRLNLTGSYNYMSSVTGLLSGSAWSTSTTDILNVDYHSLFFMVRFNSTATYPNSYTGNWDKIFAYNSGGGDRSPGIWRYQNQRYLHWRYDPANTGCDFGKNSSDQDFDLNTWYYVGVVKNGSNATAYVNGVQVKTATVSLPKTTGTAGIGIFDGHTADVTNFGALHIYNYPLTAAQVLQNFNSIRSRFGI